MWTNKCVQKIILSSLSFACLLHFSFFLSFLLLSYLCLHFLIVVNDIFCPAKVNGHFLVFCCNRCGKVEAEVVDKITASTSLFVVQMTLLML